MTTTRISRRPATPARRWRQYHRQRPDRQQRNCAGTPTACTGIGDADGDGICADVDCDDNDPNIITVISQATPATMAAIPPVNDQIDNQLQLRRKRPLPAPIGANDGDGVAQMWIGR